MPINVPVGEKGKFREEEKSLAIFQSLQYAPPPEWVYKHLFTDEDTKMVPMAIPEIGEGQDWKDVLIDGDEYAIIYRIKRVSVTTIERVQ